LLLRRRSNVFVEIFDSDLAKAPDPLYPALNGQAGYGKPYVLLVANQVVKVLARDLAAFTLYNGVYRLNEAGSAVIFVKSELLDRSHVCYLSFYYKTG
jgi:hypothetical protein